MLALAACSGRSPVEHGYGSFDASVQATDAGHGERTDGRVAQGAPAADASAPMIVHPKVKLAPALETALSCDNAELDFDFDATPRDFDLDQAFWMMWFTERSFFSDQPDTAQELLGIGFDRYAAFEDASTGLQLYVAGSDDAVVVAFRGSTELGDWLGDFNFPEDDGALHGVTGRVHRGFASALSPTFDAIRKTVRDFASAGQPIWVTGHSLGGAEATLAATRLARDGERIGPLYTFGAPRAGDGTFSKDAFEVLHRRAFRIVNERDLVPHLPPAAVAADEAAKVLPLANDSGASLVRELDYRHVGQMAWLAHALGTELTMLPVMSDDDDRPYWTEAGQGGAFGLISGSSQQGARHAQQRYLCRLLALRRADHAQISMGASPERDAAEAQAREDNWALRATRAIDAWQLVRARGHEPGEGVLIAHPDTGTSEHPELLDHPLGKSPIVWSLAHDFVDGDDDPRHDFSAANRIPAHGHGTETSSVMVSPLACPFGVAQGPCVSGAAPGAKLIPLRVSESVVLLGGDAVADAVRYAIEVGAHVISISMGGVTPMPKLESAIADALAAGIIVVAAAGNNVLLVKPCTLDGVVCAAGATPMLAPWAGSSRGDRVDISAPATEVRFAKTTQNGQGQLVYEIGLASGTSDATALTAAAAALWLSYHGRDALLARYGSADLPKVFRKLVKEHAYDTPPSWPTDGSYGPGILNMMKLLEAPLP